MKANLKNVRSTSFLWLCARSGPCCFLPSLRYTHCVPACWSGSRLVWLLCYKCPHSVRSFFPPRFLARLTDIRCIAFGARDDVHQRQHGRTSWCPWSRSDARACSRTPCFRCTGKSGSGAIHTWRSLVLVLLLLVVLLVAAQYALKRPSGFWPALAQYWTSVGAFSEVTSALQYWKKLSDKAAKIWQLLIPFADKVNVFWHVLLSVFSCFLWQDESRNVRPQKMFGLLIVCLHSELEWSQSCRKTRHVSLYPARPHLYLPLSPLNLTEWSLQVDSKTHFLTRALFTRDDESASTGDDVIGWVRTTALTWATGKGCLSLADIWT